MKRGRIRTLVGGITASAALLVAAPIGAIAATTVGQTAPDTGAADDCVGGTVFLTPQVGSPPSYEIPQDGVLTSWSVMGETGDGQAGLKLLEPLGSDTYRVVGGDATRTVVPGTLNTFSVQIPVKAGELLGFWAPDGNHPCAFDTTDPEDVLAYLAGSFPEPQVDDEFTTDTEEPSRRTNISATLETKECKGKAPTMAGTSGTDTLIGTSGKDVIVGLEGKDTIKGSGGNDRLCGQAGKDKLKGGAGKDKLQGGKKSDKLKGGGGEDKCAGGGGDDTAKKCEVEKSI